MLNSDKCLISVCECAIVALRYYCSGLLNVPPGKKTMIKTEEQVKKWDRRIKYCNNNKLFHRWLWVASPTKQNCRFWCFIKHPCLYSYPFTNFARSPLDVIYLENILKLLSKNCNKTKHIIHIFQEQRAERVVLLHSVYGRPDWQQPACIFPMPIILEFFVSSWKDERSIKGLMCLNTWNTACVAWLTKTH